MFRLIYNEQSIQKQFEYPLTLYIAPGQHFEFQSTDPEEFIPSIPENPCFLTYNLDPIIPSSLMNYLERESLVIFHSYKNGVALDSKYFEKISD